MCRIQMKNLLQLLFESSIAVYINNVSVFILAIIERDNVSKRE